MANSITAGEALTLVFPRFATIRAKWKEQIDAEHQQDVAQADAAGSDEQYTSIFTDEQP